MIDVYYHLCALNEWRVILSDQLHALVLSGLYQKIDHFFISLLGSNDLRLEAKTYFKEFKKCKIVFESDKLDLFEFPALQFLYQNCRPDDRFLYWHCKGVRYPLVHSSFLPVQDWRKYMEYFCLYNYQDRLRNLLTYDACGCNHLQQVIGKKRYEMFSGNFWWSKGSYVRSLEYPQPSPDNMQLGQSYIDAELWILSKFPRPYVHEVHNSFVNHYVDRYPREKYVLNP